MKVKCMEEYYDLKLDRMVQEGEEFEVSDARAKELTSYNNKAGRPLVKAIDSENAAKARRKKDE